MYVPLNMNILVIFFVVNIAKSESPQPPQDHVHYELNNGDYGQESYYHFNSDVNTNANDKKRIKSDPTYSDYNNNEGKDIRNSHLDHTGQLSGNPKPRDEFTEIIDHYETSKPFENLYPQTSQQGLVNNPQGDYKKDILYVPRYPTEPHYDPYRLNANNFLPENSYHPEIKTYSEHGTVPQGREYAPINEPSVNNKEEYVSQGQSKQIHSAQESHRHEQPVHQNKEITYPANQGDYGRDLKSDFKPSEPFQPSYPTAPLSSGFTPSFGPPSKSLQASGSPPHTIPIQKEPVYPSDQNTNHVHQWDFEDGKPEKEITVQTQPYQEASDSVPRAPKVYEMDKNPEVDYKVIFVKTPEESHLHATEIKLPPSQDHKTVMYLLSNSPQLDHNENIKVVTPAPAAKPAYPEVYFLQYNRDKNLNPHHQVVPTSYDYLAYPQVHKYDPFELRNSLSTKGFATVPSYGDIQGYSRSHAQPNLLNVNNGLSSLIFPGINPLTNANSYYQQPSIPNIRHQQNPKYSNLMNAVFRNAYTNIIDPQSYLNLGAYPQQQQELVLFPNQQELVSPKVHFGGDVSQPLGQLRSNSINSLTNIVPHENELMRTYAPSYTPYNPNSTPIHSYPPYPPNPSLSPALASDPINLKSAPNQTPSPSSNPSDKYYIDRNSIAELLKAYGFDPSSVTRDRTKHEDSNGSESERNSVSQLDRRDKFTRSTTFEPPLSKLESESNFSVGVSKREGIAPSNSTSTTQSPKISPSTESTTSQPSTTQSTLSTTVAATTIKGESTGQSIHLKVPLLPHKDDLLLKEKMVGDDKVMESGSEEIYSDEEEPGGIDQLDLNSQMSSSEESGIEENSLETGHSIIKSEDVEKTSQNEVPLFFEASKTKKKGRKNKMKVLSSGRKIRIQPSEARRLRGYKKITKVKKSSLNMRKSVKILNQ